MNDLQNTNVKTVSIMNEVLASNTLLMKAVVLMYQNKHWGDILWISGLSNVVIKCKTNTGMINIGELSKQCYSNFILNIKLALQMNFLNYNSIHQGSFPIKIDNTIISFRISIHPSYNGDNISLRAIRSQYFNTQIPDNFIYEGLTLIGGKTGSGKTTLYYSLLQNFNGNIISIEDPVEYPIDGINQTNVQDCGYEASVKSSLRQVPDLIGIGEIRDIDSAKAAINASLTGHAVITTMHFSNINQMLMRFKQFSLEFNFPINQIIIMNDHIPQIIHSSINPNHLLS